VIGQFKLVDLSIVSPVYNSEKIIDELWARLKNTLDEMNLNFEVILIDDGSSDDSWGVIERIARKEKRVVGLKLVQNYGQHQAIVAGMSNAKGDLIVVMDCDLQDPPEAIPLLYKKIFNPYQVVIARFNSRKQTFVRQKVSELYWFLVGKLSGIPFDENTGNFRMFSSNVKNQILSFPEQVKFLSGIMHLIGYKADYIEIDRDKRYSGKSTYSLKKLVKLSVDLIVSYSDLPLKVSIFLGFIISSLSFFGGLIFLVYSINNDISIPGWLTLILSLYFIGGAIILNLGIVGIYIGRIFRETKNRPVYLIEKITER
jgi:glycosyltransferase involved in cell wall biosynthesis